MDHTAALTSALQTLISNNTLIQNVIESNSLELGANLILGQNDDDDDAMLYRLLTLLLSNFDEFKSEIEKFGLLLVDYVDDLKVLDLVKNQLLLPLTCNKQVPNRKNNNSDQEYYISQNTLEVHVIAVKLWNKLLLRCSTPDEIQTTTLLLLQDTVNHTNTATTNNNNLRDFEQCLAAVIHSTEHFKGELKQDLSSVLRFLPRELISTEFWRSNVLGLSSAPSPEQLPNTAFPSNIEQESKNNETVQVSRREASADIEALSVRNATELQQICEQIKSDLEVTDANFWSIRLDALHKLRRLVASGILVSDISSHYDNVSRQTFIQLLKSMPIAEQIEDLRSKITSEVCELCADVAFALKEDFGVFAEQWFPSLLNLSKSGIRIMASQAENCVVEIMSYSSGAGYPRVLSIFLQGCIEKKIHQRYKKCCAISLTVALRLWSPQSLKPQMTTLCKAIGSVIADGNPDVREEGRKGYWALHSRFEIAANNVLSKMDSMAQKHLDRSCKTSNAEWEKGGRMSQIIAGKVDPGSAKMGGTSSKSSRIVSARAGGAISTTRRRLRPSNIDTNRDASVKMNNAPKKIGDYDKQEYKINSVSRSHATKGPATSTRSKVCSIERKSIKPRELSISSNNAHSNGKGNSDIDDDLKKSSSSHPVRTSKTGVPLRQINEKRGKTSSRLARNVGNTDVSFSFENFVKMANDKTSSVKREKAFAMISSSEIDLSKMKISSQMKLIRCLKDSIADDSSKVGVAAMKAFAFCVANQPKLCQSISRQTQMFLLLLLKQQCHKELEVSEAALKCINVLLPCVLDPVTDVLAAFSQALEGNDNTDVHIVALQLLYHILSMDSSAVSSLNYKTFLIQLSHSVKKAGSGNASITALREAIENIAIFLFKTDEKLFLDVLEHLKASELFILDKFFSNSARCLDISQGLRGRYHEGNTTSIIRSITPVTKEAPDELPTRTPLVEQHSAQNIMYSTNDDVKLCHGYGVAKTATLEKSLKTNNHLDDIDDDDLLVTPAKQNENATAVSTNMGPSTDRVLRYMHDAPISPEYHQLSPQEEDILKSIGLQLSLKSRVKDKYMGMHSLIRVAKEGNHKLWCKHYGEILLCLLEGVSSTDKPVHISSIDNRIQWASPTSSTLGDEASLRHLYLQGVRAMIKYQSVYVPEYMELIFDRLLASTMNSVDEVVCTAEKALENLMDVSDPRKCLSVLIRYICREEEEQNNNYKKVLSSLRLLCKIIPRVQADDLQLEAPRILPVVSQTINHKTVDTRKASVFVLVELYFVLKDIVLREMQSLSAAQRKLVTIYIEKHPKYVM